MNAPKKAQRSKNSKGEENITSTFHDERPAINPITAYFEKNIFGTNFSSFKIIACHFLILFAYIVRLLEGITY